MRPIALWLLAAGALSVAGCGGGSGGGGSVTGYAFVPPPVNSLRKYNETIVDNQHNAIELSYTETVLNANPDGSYVVLQEDPNHESVTVNGTIYSIETETVTLNDSGQELSYTAGDVGAVGEAVLCTFTPHGPGPDSPVTVGMSWTLDYTFGCGAPTPVSYVQSGSAVDVESVTVPAGTYSALKLQSTISWTNALGTKRTQTITNWRDIATSVPVKQSITISYSGTLPSTGYAISREIVLESMS